MAEGMDEARARVIIARIDEIIDFELDSRAQNGRITDANYDAAILAAVERIQVAGITPEEWANALVATGEERHADLIAALRDSAAIAVSETPDTAAQSRNEPRGIGEGA